MPWESWYDLAVRELSERTDPVKEKLAEVAEASLPEPTDTEDEDESAEPEGALSPKG